MNNGHLDCSTSVDNPLQFGLGLIWESSFVEWEKLSKILAEGIMESLTILSKYLFQDSAI